MSQIGVFFPNDPSRVTAFEAFLGRPIDLAMIHTGRNGWSDWDGCIPWLVGVAGALPRRQHWSVPLVPTGVSLDDAAAGKFNASHYVLAAKAIAAARPRDSTIHVRTGWEMNGSWQPWAAKGREAAFIAAYRQFVAAFRSVSPRFRFDWCVNVGDQGMNPEVAYPGDDVVDVISMDIYHTTTNGDPSDPAKAWSAMMDRPYGLRWHKAFAAGRSKPRAFPEWGVSLAGFDSYIQAMAAWVSAPDVLFHAYWDDAAFQIRDGRLGSTSAAMQAAFSA